MFKILNCTFKDRPSPPENLQTSVEEGICVLLWKKSKDDGGAPIEHYQVLIIILVEHYFFRKLNLFFIYTFVL